jgi:CBS domain-containing protein
MNRQVETVNPTSTVKAAADMMRSLDLTVLPVCEERKILGILTDREMTTRIAAVGRDPGSTLVKDIMNTQVAILSEEDDVKAAERLMTEKRSHWVFVTDPDRNLVGILSLGKVAQVDNPKAAGQVVRQISLARKSVG